MEVFIEYAKIIGDLSNANYETEDKQNELVLKCSKMHIAGFEFLRLISDLYHEHNIFNIGVGTFITCASLLHIKLVRENILL